ncbi:MAG: ribonuclease E/G, partial [Candidatus Krumholzibacteria bacterium]|nr:ribonuclease E/G [Candidatus Krumholzibacteria bacterium]
MKKEILINYTPREVRIAILEDKELVEFLIEREDSRRSVGDVYLGQIAAVIPGIQAAFVDIGQEKAAFLHVSDVATGSIDPELLDDDEIDLGRRRRRTYAPIESLLQKGQEIVVQVRKEAIGTKGPRISSQLSLPGRYAVLMPNLDHIGISKKVDNRKERQRLRNIVRKYRPKGAAIIVRTAGQGVSSDQIRDDIKYLEKLWKDVRKNVELATPPALVHEDVDLTVFALRDLFTDKVDQIIIDSKEEYDRLKSYLKSMAPNLVSRVKLYKEKIPILDYYEIERE